MAEHLSFLTVFAIAMALIVLVPRVMERFGLPGVLGFLFVGVLLGPQGTNLVRQDGPVIVLFAELGKLLFMFFVGFDVELDELNQSKKLSIPFGVLTFLCPFALGTGLGLALGYNGNASILMGSIIASHTLLAYPLLTKLGLHTREPVRVVVGGTVLTDVAAMLVLAVCVTVHATGFSWRFLAIELAELAVFVPLVIFGLSKLTRKAIIRFGQTPESRLTIVIVLLVVAAELGTFIKLEGIVGAFLAGIAVRRAVRGSAFAVDHLHVVARALFIPAFFVATGFLLDFRTIGSAIVSRPALVFGLVAALVLGKWLAAAAVAKLGGWTPLERKMAWSMSLPQMAATLASAVVGYQAVNAAGERLLDNAFVNASLVVVVATCIAGPILSKRYAKPWAAVPYDEPMDDTPEPAATAQPAAGPA